MNNREVLKMIDNNIKRIYIYCPAYIKSGGPELLHQLGSELGKYDIENYMVYYDCANRPCHTHPEFEKYNTKEADEIDVKDEESSLIIVPEAAITQIRKYKSAKKGIWWLSVDNFTKWATVKGRYESFGLVHSFSNPGLLISAKKVVQTSDFHFCQSHYAKKYVMEKQKIEKNKVFMLSDYISDNYVYEEGLCRQNFVAYFPRKGYEIVKELIKDSPDICWKPIENMTSDQVKDLLCHSKVYVDFGGFPGKDRVPREAAMCGCCVITGTRGASAFQEDVPIKSSYKFENPLLDKEKIVMLIRDCMENYDDHILDFHEYRQIIQSEKAKFSAQVSKLFVNKQ